MLTQIFFKFVFFNYYIKNYCYFQFKTFNRYFFIQYLTGNNKCYPTLSYLDLNNLLPVIIKYITIMFNYIDTLGFIHALHLLLNELYSYLNEFTFV
jgi:hypothetical protein